MSMSPLRYFQRHGRGHHGARDYKALGREDPFRSGQVAFYPRLSFHHTTVERMISKPSPTKAYFRTFY